MVDRAIAKIVERWRPIGIVLFMVLALPQIVLWFYDQAILDRREPYSTPFVVVKTNSPIKQGELLWVTLSRQKVRFDCFPVISFRTAISQETGKRWPIDAGTTRGGTDPDFVEVGYPVGELPQGFYLLQVSLKVNCPHETYSYTQPDIPFSIVEDKDAPSVLQQLKNQNEQIERLTEALKDLSLIEGRE